MQHWQEEKKRTLAIFGKQAVNSYEQIRGNMEGLEKATQQSFADSVEGMYRRLAGLLAAEKRLASRRSVLDALKEEESGSSGAITAAAPRVRSRSVPMRPPWTSTIAKRAGARPRYGTNGMG